MEPLRSPESLLVLKIVIILSTQSFRFLQQRLQASNPRHGPALPVGFGAPARTPTRGQQGKRGQLQINHIPTASQCLASSKITYLTSPSSSQPSSQAALIWSLACDWWAFSAVLVQLGTQPHACPHAEPTSELRGTILHRAWGCWEKPLKGRPTAGADAVFRGQGWEPPLYFKSSIISTKGFRHLGRSQGSLSDILEFRLGWHESSLLPISAIILR